MFGINEEAVRKKEMCLKRGKGFDKRKKIERFEGGVERNHGLFLFISQNKFLFYGRVCFQRRVCFLTISFFYTLYVFLYLLFINYSTLVY